jgi:hypothetical protein
MVFQIRKNSLIRQRKTSRKINRKSRQLNKQGGTAVVHILHAQRDGYYYLIYIADNRNDLKLFSKDVPENMQKNNPFREEVLNKLYIQTISINTRPKNYDPPIKLEPTEVGIPPMKGEDERLLYFTLNERGLVKYIYTNKADLEKIASGAEIFTFKKNYANWESPIF